MHLLSRRASHRFAAVNCAAIPESLLESELFGHVKGAFTDASQDRKGIFELCSGGTLLLDEIGDMPISLQAKLLRVLEERVVTPVGSGRSIPVDVRVIAATHCDLIEEIAAGRFREDLYHRLSVIPIHVPPLRHRKEDIPQLVEHFRTELNGRFGKQVAPPDREVLQRIVAYDWPGNIRELRNAVERAIVLSRDGQIALSDIFQHLGQRSTATTTKEVSAEALGTFYQLPLTEAKAAFEKAYVEQKLRETAGNVSGVAKLSGRYRVDVYRLIEKYGINQNEFRQ